MTTPEPMDGVLIKPLKLVPNERGRLMEVQRNDDDGFPGFGQAYITETNPGVVKAWYRHKTQIDQIAVVTGLLKLVLFDGRKGNASTNSIREIVMGELSPKLVQIPPGIWHGFTALGTKSSFLLHLNSVPYNFSGPDEERIDPDSAEIPYDWTRP